MDKIAVFPCDSEIALEIHRAFVGIKNVQLINLSSNATSNIEGCYTNFPHVDNPNFISVLNEFVKKEKINFIFPANDAVIMCLSQHNINCQIIGSSAKTCQITRSKLQTYKLLSNVLLTPKLFNVSNAKFPCFLKPEIGQGSKGTFIAQNTKDLEFYLNKDPSLLILEYLPGEEFTVDCFTDFNRQLRCCCPRKRCRISNGISIETHNVEQINKFLKIALLINKKLELNGAWFFQVKRNTFNHLTLLEVSPRIGGSSGLTRIQGINLPVLSYYNQLGILVDMHGNTFDAILSRNLSNKYKLNITYDHVYIDFDDCIYINNKLNSNAIKFLVEAINKDIKIHLITKHISGNIRIKLIELKILDLFDEVIAIKPEENKSDYIIWKNAIFIDDSFKERQLVSKSHKIPVFSVDAIEGLLK